jgi:hypothetical protein
VPYLTLHLEAAVPTLTLRHPRVSCEPQTLVHHHATKRSEAADCVGPMPGPVPDTPNGGKKFVPPETPGLKTVSPDNSIRILILHFNT